MNIVKINVQNSREGILTIDKDYFTCISDQAILENDVILHESYTKLVGVDVNTIVVDRIVEERPSKGDWKDKVPTTWRKCEYTRKNISSNVIKEAGYLKTEIIIEQGKQVEKIFLMI